MTPNETTRSARKGFRGLAAALLGIVLAAPGLAQETQEGARPLTLADAVARALAANPGLQAVEARQGEVEAGVAEARADAFPQLSAITSWGQSRNPAFLNSPDFGSILDQFPGADFTPSVQELYGLGVEVSQPLYTGGKVKAAVELARKVAAVADAQIRTTRLDTALAAAEAFYELLAAERALAAVEGQERARRAALEVVQARYDLGDATELERLRSTAAVAEVGPEVARLRGDVEVAESRLKGVLALDPAAPLEVAEGAVTADLPAMPSREQLLAVARRNRPEIADLEQQRAALALQQEVTRAEARPQLDLTGAYGRQARLPENLGENLYQDWRFSLDVRWEFFDGGRREAQIARIESQRRQRELELADLLNRIGLEIEEAAAEYRAAAARHRAAEASAAAAREATRVAAETYQEGVSLQADLLDAQQRETAAELALIDAYYDARREEARLARALGRLPTEPPAAVAARSGPVGEEAGEEDGK